MTRLRQGKGATWLACWPCAGPRARLAVEASAARASLNARAGTPSCLDALGPLARARVPRSLSTSATGVLRSGTWYGCAWRLANTVPECSSRRFGVPESVLVDVRRVELRGCEYISSSSRRGPSASSGDLAARRLGPPRNAPSSSCRRAGRRVRRRAGQLAPTRLARARRQTGSKLVAAVDRGNPSLSASPKCAATVPICMFLRDTRRARARTARPRSHSICTFSDASLRLRTPYCPGLLGTSSSLRNAPKNPR